MSKKKTETGKAPFIFPSIIEQNQNEKTELTN